MTRINLILVEELKDQHLMAEYRELPMVLASARRSNTKKFVSSSEYVLGKGHVTFFYDKKEFLLKRYELLIVELKSRGYNINPDGRMVDFSSLDKFPQNTNWKPTSVDIAVSRDRIEQRISEKPQWYRYTKIHEMSC